jgi:uncharacterized protein (UPF0261 family)
MGASSAMPVVLAPGCVDMCNFGPRASVPGKYSSRLLYEWNANVTLMRTSVEENRRMGEVFATKLNAATGPVAVLIPLRGVSVLDGDGQPFCDREADRAMFQALKAGLRPGIAFEEIDANINDPVFSSRAVAMMLELIADKKRPD